MVASILFHAKRYRRNVLWNLTGLEAYVTQAKLIQKTTKTTL